MVSFLPIPVDYLHITPGYAPLSSIEEIDRWHAHYCRLAKIPELFPLIEWEFSKRLRSAVGVAEYWEDGGEMHWTIKYSSNHWLQMTPEARRNTIAHEICHLAVEKLYGHCARPKDGREPVLDHGRHWRELMAICGEDPDMPAGLD